MPLEPNWFASGAKLFAFRAGLVREPGSGFLDSAKVTYKESHTNTMSVVAVQPDNFTQRHARKWPFKRQLQYLVRHNYHGQVFQLVDFSHVKLFMLMTASNVFEKRKKVLGHYFQ